jgi:hypothetical protein
MVAVLARSMAAVAAAAEQAAEQAALAGSAACPFQMAVLVALVERMVFQA